MFHAGHKVAVGYDVSNHPSFHSIGEEEDDDGPNAPHDEDLNYTMFDLTVDSIDVTLSFARWWQGKGLVVDAVVKGVRGVLGGCHIVRKASPPLTSVLFQIVVMCSGTQTILWILCSSGTNHSPGTSS